MKTAENMDELEPHVPMDCCGQDLKSLEQAVQQTAYLVRRGLMALAELYNTMAIKAPKDAKVLRMQALQYKNQADALENVVLPDEQS